MTQRKKQSSINQREKEIKAQQKNDFFRKIRTICDSCCTGKNIYPLLPAEELEKLYNFRFYALRIIPAAGQVISDKVLDHLKHHLSIILKYNMLTIQPNKPQISVADYLSYGQTLSSYYLSQKEINSPTYLKIKDSLDDFGSNEKLQQSTWLSVGSYLNVLGITYNNMGDKMYWLNFDLQTHLMGLMNVAELYCQEPECIHIDFKGNTRPAYRVRWAFSGNGIINATFKPSECNIKNPIENLDVYIQSHALERLAERIDCIDIGVTHTNIYLSAVEPKVFYVNQTMLLEYRFWGTKAGYFVTDIVGNKLILRTFLFVTNNGTPEGQLLEKNTGLQKLDKKYLAIDKLSTFMSSDIAKNPEVQKIFQDAGCQCLMDLYQTTEGMRVEESEHPTRLFHSQALLDYLSYKL
jgi:hypothetical protein